MTSKRFQNSEPKIDLAVVKLLVTLDKKYYQAKEQSVHAKLQMI